MITRCDRAGRRNAKACTASSLSDGSAASIAAEPYTRAIGAISAINAAGADEMSDGELGPLK